MAVQTQPHPNQALTFFADRFGLDADLCQEVLSTALANGGDHADLYAEYTRSRKLTLEDGVVNGGTAVDAGVGVRVVIGSAVGYATTERFEREALLAAARTAREIAAGGGLPPATAALPSPIPVIDHYPNVAPPVDEPAPAALALLRRAESAARAASPTISYVFARLWEEVKQVVVATSDGRLAGDTRPLVRLSVMVVSVRNGDRQQGGISRAARAGLDRFADAGWTPEDAAREAARQALLGHEAVEAPAGFLPVVLAPGDSGVWLHEAVGHGLEGDFNWKRLSAFSGRVGELVATPVCTVIDDGTQPGRYGSINIDDEGVPSAENVLIENGVLRGYLHDWISARQFGVAATGSGRRESFRYVPMPRMTTTYLRGGDASPEDIVRSVKRGVYCVSFDGGSVDIANGDYVFSTREAYLIEDGRITAPLRTTNLIGNGPDSMTRVTMVGNDLEIDVMGGMCGKRDQSVPVNLGVPTVLVDGITVGGTQQ